MELYTLNIASVGGRGRPAHPKPHSVVHEQVLNHKRVPLGELVLEPLSDGSVKLRAIVNGKAKVFTFPATTGKSVAIPTSTYNRKSVAKKRPVKAVRKTTTKPVNTRKAGVKVFAASGRKRTTTKA